MPIPKIIHFIWLGQALPLGRLNNILEWANLNKEFQINLWLDSEGDQINSLFGEHFSTAVKNTKQLLDNEIKEIVSNNHVYISNITVKEINDLQRMLSEEKFYWECIRHEIDKLRPNYGAASDLLRMAILELYGGAYYDSDVAAIDLCSRTSEDMWSNSTTSLYLYNLSSNDIIICSPHDPLLAEWRQQVILNQQAKCKSFTRLMYDTYLSDNPFYITLNTMRTTGPSTIVQLPGSTLGKIIQNIKLRKTSAIESAQSWCNRKLKQLEDNDEANVQILYKYLLKIVKFEIESSGILRLEDHINNFIRSVGYTNEAERSNLQSMFIDTIESFLKKDDARYLKQIGYAQCTFEHDLVCLFYERNDLLNKTCLLPWDLRVIKKETLVVDKPNDDIREAVTLLPEITKVIPHSSTLDQFVDYLKICMKYATDAKRPNKEHTEEKLYKIQCLELEELQSSLSALQQQMVQNAWLDDSLIIKFSINYITYIGNDVNIINILAQFKETITFRECFILKYTEKIKNESNMQLLLQDLAECSDSNKILLGDIDTLLKIDKDKIREFYKLFKIKQQEEEHPSIWDYSSSDEEKESPNFLQIKSFIEGFTIPTPYPKNRLGCS